MASDKFKATIYFDEIELAPGEIREIAARVEDRIGLFRGQDLIAVESQPHATLINDLVLATRAGDRRQMPVTCGVPSAAFSGYALGSGLRLDTFEPALGTARITVFNTNDEPVKWSAKLEGVAIAKEDM